MVRSLGADRVIDYKKEDFTKSGRAYDVIFDAVYKTSFRRAKSSLKRGGIYLTVAWPLLQARPFAYLIPLVILCPSFLLTYAFLYSALLVIQLVLEQVEMTRI